MEYNIKVRMFTDDDCTSSKHLLDNTDNQALYGRHLNALIEDLKMISTINHVEYVQHIGRESGEIIIDSQLDNNEFYGSIKYLIEREKNNIYIS